MMNTSNCISIKFGSQLTKLCLWVMLKFKYQGQRLFEQLVEWPFLGNNHSFPMLFTLLSSVDVRNVICYLQQIAETLTAIFYLQYRTEIISHFYLLQIAESTFFLPFTVDSIKHIPNFLSSGDSSKHITNLEEQQKAERIYLIVLSSADNRCICYLYRSKPRRFRTKPAS